MDIKIGCDPEFFLKNKEGFVSGWGLVPGTKMAPHKVAKGAVQLDGFAAEFNIDPASSCHEFVDNINTVLQELRGMIDPAYTFEFEPVARFSEEHMKAQPPEVLALGCDPDFNAYTMSMNEPPNANQNMRTASGHIHIGWTEEQDANNPSHVSLCADLVKQLDRALGIPSVIFDPDATRRSMYGKAGCFRPKPYGVEYRVLSNFWIKKEETMEWVYNTTRAAIDAFAEGKTWLENVAEEEVERIINLSDVSAARKLV